MVVLKYFCYYSTNRTELIQTIVTKRWSFYCLLNILF